MTPKSAPTTSSSVANGLPEPKRPIRVPRLTFQIPGIQRFSCLYLLALIFVVFSAWIPDLFLSRVTMQAVFSGQVIEAILGLALLIPLTAGVFDLSVNSMAAFALVIIARMQQSTRINIVLCCVIAIVICCAFGWLNGFLVVRLKVNSFIATLGTSQVLIAIALLLSKDQQITGVFSQRFLDLGQGNIFGMPVVVFYLAVIAIIVWYVMEWTRVGRTLFATGANIETARLSGVRTERLIYGSFVASAGISGLAGLIYGAQVGSYSSTFSTAELFPAFAAVFLGATQFYRRPNVWGTILAVYTLAFGVQGLELAAPQGVYWFTPLFNGTALIIAVAFAAHSKMLPIGGKKGSRKDDLPAEAIAQDPQERFRA
jgi:ribose transport system permease protein